MSPEHEKLHVLKATKLTVHKGSLQTMQEPAPRPDAARKP